MSTKSSVNTIQVGINLVSRSRPYFCGTGAKMLTPAPSRKVEKKNPQEKSLGGTKLPVLFSACFKASPHIGNKLYTTFNFKFIFYTWSLSLPVTKTNRLCNTGLNLDLKRKEEKLNF